MTEPSDTFRTSLRGYDTEEVDRRVDELTAVIAALTHERDALAARVRELHATPVEAPDYTHLGQRVGQILTLADTEAAELRATAQADAETHRSATEKEATRIREEADRYAAGVASDAEAEASRVVEEARKAGDEHRDNAERAASARLQEAEAVYEEQRARAAKAAADFETTLAGRRQSAEDEFTHKMSQSQSRLDEATQLVEITIRNAETKHDEATKQTVTMVAAAQEKAGRIVSEAKATAARIRTDSQRELAAATQRRDSINAQLSNVRQMLATLTSTVPISLAGLPVETLGGEPEAGAGDAPEDLTATGTAPTTDSHDGDADENGDQAEESRPGGGRSVTA